MSLASHFAFFSTLFLLFVTFSRLFDLFGAGLHIPMVAYGLAMLGMIWAGGFIAIFSSKISYLWIGFTAWMVLCIPTSVWRGGSFNLVFRSWPKALVIFFIVAGLTLSLDKMLKLIRSIGWSIALLAVLALKYGNTSTGRLYLDQGKLANPNDMAQAFLIGLPALWLIVRSEPLISFKRVAALISMALVSYGLLQTGSRGGMVAFGIMVLVAAMDASGRAKALVPLLMLLMAIVMAVIMPSSLKQRYLTFTVDDLDEETVESEMNVVAVASTESRMRMLKQSLRLTALNPILGVGPGMFPDATAREAKEEGKHVAWLETHNSYTQVASESGIPAFLLFVSIQWLSLKKLREILKKTGDQSDENGSKIRKAAQTLKYMFIAYAVTSFFASVAYQALLPTLTGIIVAFTATASRYAPSAAAPAAAMVGIPRVARLRPAISPLRS